MRCRCGQLMILNTSRYKGRGLYYYRCRRSSGYGPESCPQRLIRAERIEAPVWEFVYSMLTDPARLRRGLERVGEEAAASSRWTRSGRSGASRRTSRRPRACAARTRTSRRRG